MPNARTLYKVQPDTFGMLYGEGRNQPFLLERERRAIRPSTMAAKLRAHLPYDRNHRPTDVYGAPPIVLISFDDPSAADRFLRVFRERPRSILDNLPIQVTDRHILDDEGPLGSALRTAQRTTMDMAFVYSPHGGCVPPMRRGPAD